MNIWGVFLPIYFLLVWFIFYNSIEKRYVLYMFLYVYIMIFLDVDAYFLKKIFFVLINHGKLVNFGVCTFDKEQICV